MAKQSALIVDDEPDILELLSITLNRMGIETSTAGSLEEAHWRLSERSYDLCLTDMRLPDGNGIELVEQITTQYPETPVAVITAFGSMDTAISALKAGAFDFVSKPINLQLLRSLVITALKINEAKQPDSSISCPDKHQNAPYELLGDSPAIKRVKTLIEKLSRSQAPVHISGESGTGKEIAARQIHTKSPRSGATFVAINCGAIPAELMESEFFGHRKGSFTGAIQDKQGLFQAADGGTLFLDEVGDLPLDMQVKLLRAIQEKKARPVGGNQEDHIDARIISATHKNLAELVHAGKFRQDLYYRLNVIELKMPALRENRSDIENFTQHILDRREYANEPVTLSKDALAALQDYTFPGNFRELENILERAATLCENHVITEDDLLLPLSQPDATDIMDLSNASLDDRLMEMERHIIQAALDETHWNRTEAAKKLGISFRSLRYRLEKLGL